MRRTRRRYIREVECEEGATGCFCRELDRCRVPFNGAQLIEIRAEKFIEYITVADPNVNLAAFRATGLRQGATISGAARWSMENITAQRPPDAGLTHHSFSRT
jgi:hypothetical protein